MPACNNNKKTVKEITNNKTAEEDSKKRFKYRINSIVNKIVGNYGKNNKFVNKDWTFTQSSMINKHKGKTFEKPFVVINEDGAINFAYLPNIIPKEIGEEVMKYYNENFDNYSKMATIIGSWSRYKNYLHDCSNNAKSTNIQGLSNICNGFVEKVINEYSPTMVALLEKINPTLQKFARYPTLCFNVLNANNYNEKTKPYKAHKDQLDCGLGIMLYFGEFKGGNLKLSEYKIEFPVKQYDIVLINARQYEHEVSKVTSGERIGLVYFTGSAHVPLTRVRSLKKYPKDNSYSHLIEKKNKYNGIYNVTALPHFSTQPPKKIVKNLKKLQTMRRKISDRKRINYNKKYK